MREVRELLGLAVGAREIKVHYGFIADDDTTLALHARSMLHIMVDMTMRTEVPDKDVAENRTVAVEFNTESAEPFLMNIRCSDNRDSDAFVSVEYRGHSFWISDRDYTSKRTFAFLMILFSLMETGGKERLPIVTIPAT